jgi:hypothetical protein
MLQRSVLRSYEVLFVGQIDRGKRLGNLDNDLKALNICMLLDPKTSRFGLCQTQEVLLALEASAG